MAISRLLFQFVVIVAGPLASLFAGSRALGQFTVPDDCMRGAGAYEGDLSGTGGFRVDVDSGPQKLFLCFSGAIWDIWAGENPPLSPGTTEAVILECLIHSSGGFNSSIATYPGTGYSLSAEGMFNPEGPCGITGAWQLRSQTGVFTTGTFNFPAGSGANCLDVSVTPPACGAPCGPMGAGVVMSTALGSAFIRMAITRRRRSSAVRRQAH